MTVGFLALDNWPLPKSQFQNVGLPVEASLKVTVNGAHPAESETVKSATGACPKALAVISSKSITQNLVINTDVFSVTDFQG